MEQRGIMVVRSARTVLFVALLVGFGLSSVGVTSASASETPGSESVLRSAAQLGAAQFGAAQSEAAQSVAPPSATSLSADSPSATSTSAAQKPFPIGYVIGGILVILGIGGGIYGQRMRIRARKPPRP